MTTRAPLVLVGGKIVELPTGDKIGGAPAGEDGTNGVNAETINGTCCGRLTLESGVAVSTSDQSSKTTVYFTPFMGAQIGLYDGSQWAVISFSETSLALGTLTSGKNYDVFAYNNSGTLALELSAAWTSDTTRSDALALQNGIYVKSGTTTRRYLGTFRTTSTTTTEDSAGGSSGSVGGKRFLWNYYNRRRRPLHVIDTTDSWIYATTTWRQARATAGNKVEYVSGINDEVIQAHLTVVIQNTATSGSSIISIAQDSITVPSLFTGSAFNNGGLQAQATTAVFNGYAGLGYHYLAWMEKGGGTGGSGTTNWFGDNAGAFQSGLTAFINC